VRQGGWLGLAGVICLGAALYAHRALLHEIVVDGVAGLIALAGLCLAVAAATRLAGRRQPAPVREPAPVTRPAVRRPAGLRSWPRPARRTRTAAAWVAGQARPAAGLMADSADLCGSCSSRPAVIDRAGWPLCQPCADKVNAAASHAHEVAEAALADPAGYLLTQPPVLPPGETVGTVDMTEFEDHPS